MDTDRKHFWLDAFTALVQVWTFLEPSKSRIETYDGALSDLTVEQLRAGVAWVLANHSGSQPPTPGLIRDGALGPLVWTPRFHWMTGKEIGREQQRKLQGKPAPLGVLQPDRARQSPPSLPESVTAELEKRLTP